MLLRANPMLKKMLLRANPPEEVAPTGKPHSIGFARRSNAVTYKRQRKYLGHRPNMSRWGSFLNDLNELVLVVASYLCNLLFTFMYI